MLKTWNYFFVGFLPRFIVFLPSFTGLDLLFKGFTGFYLVLPGFTCYSSVLPSSNRFLTHLKGFLFGLAEFLTSFSLMYLL